MPIINEIVHPTQFRSSYHKASTNIAYTAFWLSRKQQEVIRRYDLTWTDFGVLSILRERFPYALHGTKIRARLSYIAFAIKNVAKKLKEKDLIEYNAHAPNKDDIGFCITKNGLRLLTRIDKRIFEVDRIIASLSPGEAEELSALLDKARG